MARLGLAHWHMFEQARIAALGTGREPGARGVDADAADANPWDVLHATLALPTHRSGSAMATTSDGQPAS